MFNRQQAMYIANKLGIKFDKFSFEDFYTGLNIELEHGRIHPRTNVTNNNLEMTAKIALAHLDEFSDYYNQQYGLPAMERHLEYLKKQKQHGHHNHQGHYPIGSQRYYY